MSAAAAIAKCKYKAPPLTREEALDIINAMPFLVCSSTARLLVSQIKPEYRDRNPRPEVYQISFEVSNGSRSYCFPVQPFRILREITRAEFKRIAPWACAGHMGRTMYYHICTD